MRLAIFRRRRCGRSIRGRRSDAIEKCRSGRRRRTRRPSWRRLQSQLLVEKWAKIPFARYCYAPPRDRIRGDRDRRGPASPPNSIEGLDLTCSLLFFRKEAVMSTPSLSTPSNSWAAAEAAASLGCLEPSLSADAMAVDYSSIWFAIA